MKRIRLSRKSPFAKCGVYYTTAVDPKTNQERPCVYLECTRGGTKIGPCWGQSRLALQRALTRLGLQCDCPARAHKASYFYGQRAADLAPNDDPRAQ